MNRTVTKNSLLFLARQRPLSPFWKCCGAAIPHASMALGGRAAFVCCSSTPYAKK